MWKSNENTWLMVAKNVVLTPIIDPKIAALDVWFRLKNCRAYVTSGLRDANKQLQIIREAAIARKLNDEYPDINSVMTLASVMQVGDKLIPAWIVAWSELLRMGFLVNPPKEAPCLFDYVHPKTGKIVKSGTVIHPSQHMRGTAFDIGGNGESKDKTIADEVVVIQEAFESKSIPGWVSYTIERENNAIHCDCEEVV